MIAAHINWTDTDQNLVTTGSGTFAQVTVDNIDLNLNTITLTGRSYLDYNDDLIFRSSGGAGKFLVFGDADSSCALFIDPHLEDPILRIHATGNVHFDSDAGGGYFDFDDLYVDNLHLDGATISSSTGAISFSNENLTTTGDVTCQQLIASHTSYPVASITRASEGTGLYGSMLLGRTSGSPAAGDGTQIYWKYNGVWCGIIAGALSNVGSGTEIGDIVIIPSYHGDDPYNNTPAIRCRADSDADTHDVMIPHSLHVGSDSAASNTLEVSDDCLINGKLTVTGATDPPCVLYDRNTRAAIVERTQDEICTAKLGGAMMFFNQDTHKMEVFVATEGKFYDMMGNVLAIVPAITKTFGSKTRYSFDRKTGEVKTKQVSVSRDAWDIKAGVRFDATDGKFYTRDPRNSPEDDPDYQHVPVEVAREDAVERKISEVTP